MNLLIRLIPAPLVRFFAKPYVAGDSLEKALEVVGGLLLERNVRSTLDLLAESIETREIAETNRQVYFDMIDAVADDPRFVDPALRPTLSLKLSSYTTDPLEQDGGKATGAREAVLQICERARDRGVRLSIDMESRHWTDFTLDFYRELVAKGHDHVGCVLQTRLHRTEADLDQLPAGCRVRIVIGIYQEPESVALLDKEQMKERLLQFGLRLLERGHFVEFGTHDEKWIRQFVDAALETHGADRFEVQMLYGVPRPKLIDELHDRGVVVRRYVPFATSWKMAIAYLRRRLDEFPAMMWLVMKNWLWRR